MKPALLLALAVLLPQSARAWGERGHNAIARVAAMRVLDGVDLEALSEDNREAYLGLRDYYRSKALELGHLANIPDTYWRKLDDETEALNAPTHFLNADDWTDDIGKLSLDYALAKQDAAKAKSRSDGKPVELFESGTVIWRAQQLFEKMIAEYRKASRAEPGSKEAKAAVQQALVYGGLMAHFIGDAGQPYHNTTDHDGWATGEGGIHSYFETASLNPQTPALEQGVYEKVPAEYPRILKESGLARPRKGTTLQEPDPGLSICSELAAACLARALCAGAFKRIPEVRAADKDLIITPSRDKTQAMRKPAEDGAEAFRPIVEDQLAASAAALAALWRAAWERGGRPDLSRDNSFDYALAPAFVEPDYDPEAIARAERGGRAKRR